MFTLLIALSYILVMALGFFLGIVIFVERRCFGEIMIKDENDQLLEIHFKPGTDLSITEYEYIVFQNKRVKNSSYNGQ